MRKGGRVIWFFGPSGAGKTTLALNLKYKHIHPSIILDGDHMRKTVSKDLGFSVEDRTMHLERMAHIATHLSDNGIDVICAFITPLMKHQNMIMRMIPNVCMVYVNAPPKREDSIFTKGVPAAHVTCYTTSETVEESIDKIWTWIQ